MPPCIIFEDEHLLVVNKPAGWNTHAPSPFVGEGIYDWLRHREPRWASLAIIHRLDKETSGVLVFGKTPLANKSLTDPFTQRGVTKKYLLLTDRKVLKKEFTVRSKTIRAGEKYTSSPHGEPAETKFGVPPSGGSANRLKPELQTLVAEPLTGRTHQIRVHAAESGFPILGDTLYGGTNFHRVCLHAAEITFKHPATGEPVAFTAPNDFAADTRAALRTAIIEPEQTNAFRLIHGAGDGQPGWFVEQLSNHLLSQSQRLLTAVQQDRLGSSRTVYHKTLSRQVGRSPVADTSPQLVSGQTAPEKFVIRENGVQFELSFNEGYSVGLFLDQRDNRRRFLTGHIASTFNFQPSTFNLLNCFAYSCGFSVCAALSGARTTSFDLSKKYLDWGKRNFALNGLDPAAHDFIFGDTFDWLRRFAKKGRAFDAIVLDPPTFSRSKESGVFQAEKDYGKLVEAALPVLKPDGILFASTNAAALTPEKFLEMISSAVKKTGRKIAKLHYVPQPPDFPVTREEPAYLKTVWLKIS